MQGILNHRNVYIKVGAARAHTPARGILMGPRMRTHVWARRFALRRLAAAARHGCRVLNPTPRHPTDLWRGAHGRSRDHLPPLTPSPPPTPKDLWRDAHGRCRDHLPRPTPAPALTLLCHAPTQIFGETPMADVEIIFPAKKPHVKPFQLVNLAVTAITALATGAFMLYKVSRGRGRGGGGLQSIWLHRRAPAAPRLPLRPKAPADPPSPPTPPLATPTPPNRPARTST